MTVNSHTLSYYFHIISHISNHRMSLTGAYIVALSFVIVPWDRSVVR